jgi:integrase
MTTTRNRSASIRKRQRQNGIRYEARWWEVNPETGERRVRGKTFLTEADARAHLDHVRHALRSGTYVSPENARKPFGVVAEEWLAASDRKARTVKGYRHVFTTWLKPWWHRPVSRVGYSDILGMVNKMRGAGLRPQTVHNVFNVLHGILAYAVDAGYVAVNPAQRVRRNLPPRGDRPERTPFTADEVAALSSLLPTPYDLLVRFAAWSGLRAGEIGGLRVARVDVLRSVVHVEETVVRLRGGMVADTPKSRRSRRKVPIPATLSREIAEYVAENRMGPEDYLFGEENGRMPLRHEMFSRRYWRPALKVIGREDATFHLLRHTYASLMAPQIDMLELSRRMGHQSYAMTADVYSHLYEREDDTQAAALDAAYTSVSRSAAPMASNVTRLSAMASTAGR